MCQHSFSSRKGWGQRGGELGKKIPWHQDAGTRRLRGEQAAEPAPPAGGGDAGASGPLGETDRSRDRRNRREWTRAALVRASQWAAVGAHRVSSVGGSECVRSGGSGRGAAGRRAGLLRGVLRLLLAARGGGRGDGQQPFFLPFLLLHSPVLEPDLNLRLVELEGGGDFHPPGPGQVLVEMKLLLQLGELLSGEVSSDSVGLPHEAVLASLACEGTCSSK